MQQSQFGRGMKKILFVILVGLTIAAKPLLAQTTQTLSISGPEIWMPGTSITLSVTDTYSGFGGGSWGLSYWFEVTSAFAPFVTVTGLAYFTFTNGNNIGTFPFSFNSTAGADPGFMTTTTANGRSGDLGGTSNPLVLIPNGTYHVTDITLAIAANAPLGTWTFRTTTANPRGSSQVTPDFNEAPFPQASFVIGPVPEPSTLALLGSAAVGVSVAIRRRKV